MFTEDKGKYTKLDVLKSISFALLIVVSAFIIQFGVVIFCEVFSLVFLRKSILDSPNGTVVASMLYAVITVVIAFVIYYFLNRKPKYNIQGQEIVAKKKYTTLKRVGIIILFGIIVQFSMSALLNFVYVFAGDTKLFRDYSELMESLDGSETSLMLVYTFFLAPLSEEYIFRGVIYSYMRKYVPMRIANVVQAALFGIFHMNIIQGVYAFFGGLLFGYIAEHKKSMLELVLFHMIVNISGILLTSAVYTLLEKIINPVVLYGVMAVIFSVITVVLLKKRFLQNDKNEVGSL